MERHQRNRPHQNSGPYGRGYGGGRGRGRGRGNRYRGPGDFNRDGRRDSNQNQNSTSEFASVTQRIGALIIGIADQLNLPLAEQIEKLSRALEPDLTKHNTLIRNTLLQCVVDLPVKSPVYGTLVGLLNKRAPEFGNDFCAELSQSINTALAEGAFSRVKLLMRFLAELVNAEVVYSSGILAYLNEFVDTAQRSIELLHASDVPDGLRNPHRQRADTYVYLALITLPWAGKCLALHKQEELEKLWTRINDYMLSRGNILIPGLLCYPTLAADDAGAEAEEQPEAEDVEKQGPLPVRAVDLLQYVYRAVSSARAGTRQFPEPWVNHTILKPYRHFSTSLMQGLVHSLNPLQIPEHTPETTYLSMGPVFQVYSNAENQFDPVDALVLRDQILDIINSFSASHKNAIKAILSLPCKAPHETLVVDAIFGELFRLPTPPFKPMYYAALLIDACRVSDSLPPVLATAMDRLFKHIHLMDVECVDRFAEWFSVHISNFDFNWAWANWKYAVAPDTPQYARHRQFLQNALERCVRLAYIGRVKKMVPEELYPLLPADPAPKHLFALRAAGFTQDVDEPLTLKARQVEHVVRQKMGESELQGWLAEKVGMDDAPKVFFPTLLTLGSKSFSHIIALLERYQRILLSLYKSPEAKLEVLGHVAKFWSASSQHITIVLDRLMTFKIVDGTAVVNWIFGQEGQALFTGYSVWDILDKTIVKTLARTATVQLELNRAAQHLSEAGRVEGSDTSVEVMRVKQVQTALTKYQREQKQLFLLIFQRFALVVNEHLKTPQPAPPVDAEAQPLLADDDDEVLEEVSLEELEEKEQQRAELTDNHDEYIQDLTRREKALADPTHDAQDFWLDNTLGHMLAVGRKYHAEIAGSLDTMANLLFSEGSTHPRLLAVFKAIQEI
eukprot:GCRY01000925.1.p1 GENE.GCRY01000925.1~~GCRY01000925.1.p1  ORF type:complete len:901 (+),score=278.07 GCRY01000925.1:95-2797(+)